MITVVGQTFVKYQMITIVDQTFVRYQIIKILTVFNSIDLIINA